MGEDLIRLDDLTLGYDRHPAVHHVSGSFKAGSLTAVVGPNGAGKSTLLKALVGLVRPLSGRIRHGGALAGVGAAGIAYLPQQAEIDRSFPISVLDCVLLGHWRRAGAFGGLSRAQVAAGRDALDAVGLGGFERRQVGTLSAGQFQRALFARILVQDAPLVLLDEPFNAIDQRTLHELLEMIRTWHAEGRTIVAVLHDFAQVRDCFPETLLLARELIAWGPTASVLSAPNLTAARTRSNIWDDDAGRCIRGAA